MDKKCPHTPVPALRRSIARKNQIAWSRIQSDESETNIYADHNHGTVIGPNRASITLNIHYHIRED